MALTFSKMDKKLPMLGEVVSWFSLGGFSENEEEFNYPNPFNPTTTIGFSIQNKSNVKITILNAIGEEVAVVLNEERVQGYHL